MTMDFPRAPPIGPAKHITRTRNSYSCYVCRRRKIKCDKVHPSCSNCSKSNETCVYDATPGLAPAKDGSASSKRSRLDHDSSAETDMHDVLAARRRGHSNIPSHIEERLERLTALVKTLSRNRLPADELHKGDGAPSRSGESSGPDPGLEYDSTSPGGSSGDAEISAMPQTPIEPWDDLNDVALGHLSLQEDGRSKYVGSTHWAYLASEVAELNDLLKEENRHISGTNVPLQASYGHGKRQRIYGNGRKTLGSLLTTHQPTSQFPNPDQPRKPFHESWKLMDDSKIRPHGAGDHVPPLQMSTLNDMLYQKVSEAPAYELAWHEELLEGIPDRRRCSILFRCFISGVHALFPIIHPPTMLKQYNDFWKWYDTREETKELYKDYNFIPLLFAILCGGALSAPSVVVEAEFPGETRPSLGGEFYDLAIHSLNQLSFLRSPTLSGLMSLLIVQTLCCREEEPLVASITFSLILRISETMGLHREPTKFGIEPIEAEVRRRIWWHIVWIDSLILNGTGWPPKIMPEVYRDIRQISELKDDLIGTERGEAYTKAVAQGERPPDMADDIINGDFSSHVSPIYIVSQGKHLMAECAEKIARIQLGVKPMGLFKQFEACRVLLRPIEEDFKKRKERISKASMASAQLVAHTSPTYTTPQAGPYDPQKFRPWEGMMPLDDLCAATVEYHQASLSAFQVWACTILDILVNKAYCMLYKPFLRNGKSKAWATVRTTALRYCHAYTDNFLTLALVQFFQPFHWEWPGGHQPLHAVMTMLVDLHERPESVESGQSRKYVDKVFELAGPDGGIPITERGIPQQRPLHEGGREAWDLLRKLREKAWIKAGLDPNILWSSKAAASASRSSEETNTAAIGKANHQSAATSNLANGKASMGPPNGLSGRGSTPVTTSAPHTFNPISYSSTAGMPPSIVSAPLFGSTDGPSTSTTRTNGNPSFPVPARRTSSQAIVITPNHTAGTTNITINNTNHFDINRPPFPPRSASVSARVAAMNQAFSPIQGPFGTTMADPYSVPASEAPVATTSCAQSCSAPAIPAYLADQPPPYSVGTGPMAPLQNEPVALLPVLNWMPLPDQQPLPPEQLVQGAADFDWGQWDAVFGTGVVGGAEAEAEDDGKGGFA